MNQVELYRTPDGTIELEVSHYEKTIWLNRAQMAELLDKEGDTIGLHLRNIYSANELDRVLTTEEFSAVQIEGLRQVRRGIVHYNLEVISSLWYTFIENCKSSPVNWY